MIIQLTQKACEFIFVVQDYLFNVVEANKKKMLFLMAITCSILLLRQFFFLFVIEETDNVIDHTLLGASLVNQLAFFLSAHV